MDDINTMIGKNVGKIRQSNGISVMELADALHLSDKTVYAYESGKARISAETLLGIVEFFNKKGIKVGVGDVFPNKEAIRSSDIKIALKICSEKDCKVMAVYIISIEELKDTEEAYRNMRCLKVVTVNSPLPQYGEETSIIIGGVLIELDESVNRHYEQNGFDETWWNKEHTENYTIMGRAKTKKILEYLNGPQNTCDASTPRFLAAEDITENQGIENIIDFFEINNNCVYLTTKGMGEYEDEHDWLMRTSINNALDTSVLNRGDVGDLYERVFCEDILEIMILDMYDQYYLESMEDDITPTDFMRKYKEKALKNSKDGIASSLF